MSTKQFPSLDGTLASNTQDPAAAFTTAATTSSSARHAYTDEEKEFIRGLYLSLPVDKRFEIIQEKFKTKYNYEIKRGTYYKIVRDLSMKQSHTAAVPPKKPRAKPRMTDSSKYPEFEKRMLNWMRRTKYRDCIEVPVMMEKAQKIFRENILPTLDPGTIVPAFGKGWCIGFLTRHGFNYRTRRLRVWYCGRKVFGVSKYR